VDAAFKLACNMPCAVQELVEHPFWKAKLPVLPLPAEPALEAFIQLHNLAPAQGDDSAASQVRDAQTKAQLRGPRQLQEIDQVLCSTMQQCQQQGHLSRLL
jgi:hypothetical protein